MKHILTLLFSSLLITTAFAQTDADREEAKRVILGEKKTSYPNPGDGRDVVLGGDNRTVYGGTERYPQRYPTASREQRMYAINRDYEAKIYSIRTNRALSRSEKERIIRQLEADRRRQIAALHNDYYDWNRRYDDEDKEYRKSKKYKNNNGNHYGWERDNGNPHKRRYYVRL